MQLSSSAKLEAGAAHTGIGMSAEQQALVAELQDQVRLRAHQGWGTVPALYRSSISLYVTEISCIL